MLGGDGFGELVGVGGPVNGRDRCTGLEAAEEAEGEVGQCVLRGAVSETSIFVEVVKTGTYRGESAVEGIVSSGVGVVFFECFVQPSGPSDVDC